jgi:hypothetical protein
VVNKKLDSTQAEDDDDDDNNQMDCQTNVTMTTTTNETKVKFVKEKFYLTNDNIPIIELSQASFYFSDDDEDNDREMDRDESPKKEKNPRPSSFSIPSSVYFFLFYIKDNLIFHKSQLIYFFNYFLDYSYIYTIKDVHVLNSCAFTSNLGC